MDHVMLFNLFGYAATICMVFGYLPQAIRTIRTRKTDDIALPTFMLLGLGSVFFVVQGFMSNPLNWPLIIANTITTVCSVIVFGIKMQNDYRKSHKK